MILLPFSIPQFGEKLRIPRLFLQPEAVDVPWSVRVPAGPSWIPDTLTSKHVASTELQSTYIRVAH